MASRSPETTRNVAFCGHGTCGKTTLIEHLLAKAGSVSRAGSIDEGSTVCDYDDQEKERKHSIDLSTSYLEHNGVTINMIDTPGYRDFVGQVYSAITAVECVVVVVDADDGVRPNTRKAWEVAETFDLPRMVVVNRLDREHAKSDEVVAEIREQLNAACHPVNVPDAAGPSFSSVSSVIGSDGGDELLESVVESNDGLMERYLGGEEISSDEVSKQLVEAVASRAVFPIFFAAGEKDIGVDELLNGIIELTPPASNSLSRTIRPLGDEEGDGSSVPTGADAPLCAFVFRVASDPFVGKLTYLRIFAGKLPANGSFLNPNSGKQEKAGKFVRLQGKEQEPVDEAVAGDIISLVKVEGLQAFDTVTSDSPMKIAAPKLPTPMYSRAVTPKSKADEKKFAEAITKVVDEDVMISSTRDSRTHEMVVAGVSQLHLLVLWDRLKARYGVEVATQEPKTPYLETIAAKGEAMHRHKKQSGGSGEFAEVHLRVEPRERGSGLEFVSSVFGGAISASYVQSVEKGIRAMIEEGVIAGYPVVDVKVDVYDGKEHPVDSKDIAFQKAGREAFKKAVSEARPVLLEPVVDLEVTFPGDTMGEIQGDLNRRRGRVVGMEAAGPFQALKAKVPLAEVPDYATQLGSMTGGQGTYTIEMSHYEEVPANVQQKVCESAKTDKQAED